MKASNIRIPLSLSFQFWKCIQTFVLNRLLLLYTINKLVFIHICGHSIGNWLMNVYPIYWNNRKSIEIYFSFLEINLYKYFWSGKSGKSGKVKIISDYLFYFYFAHILICLPKNEPTVWLIPGITFIHLVMINSIPKILMKG